RENRWYYRFLQALAQSSPQASWQTRISKNIERFRLRKLKYLCSEKLMEIEVSEEHGRFVVKLKGFLNDFSLAETFKTLSGQIPRLYQNITINLEEVYFASEKTTVKFINKLNSLTSKARDIKVIISPTNRRLLDILEKHDMKVPGFSILG
ncbi:MAG TPA: hypothetical protein DD791_03775, partial [Syntrophomonas sp.]|nr:hypothetical protein [Syntrophomonas sp.]